MPTNRFTNVDADKCVNLFGNYFGFTVTKKDDLKVAEVKALLSTTSEMDHKDAECFVCIFLSHGGVDCVYAKDGPIMISELAKDFRGDNCKSLNGKPKIFIIQACRGCDTDPGTCSEGPLDVEINKIPVEADFLYCFATVPGYVCFLNRDNGSWFLEILSDVFRRNAGDRYDILDMLTLVNRLVGIKYQSNTIDHKYHDKKQQPSFTSMLTRKFYLLPSSHMNS